MRERLELRPVGFRPVAVEMGSKPRLARFLGRDVVEAGRRGDARYHRSIPAHAIAQLLELRQCAVAHAAQRHGAGSRFPCDVPEYVLIGPTAELMPLVKATAARLQRNAPLEKRRWVEGLRGLRRVHVERVSRKLLHVADHADTIWPCLCVARSARGGL